MANKIRQTGIDNIKKYPIFAGNKTYSILLFFLSFRKLERNTGHIALTFLR